MPTVLVTGASCYAELAVSSLTVALTIATTHITYPRTDGQAELVWVAWLNTKKVYPRTVTHLSTNPARRRVTSVICPTTLPLSQTATLRKGNRGGKEREGGIGEKEREWRARIVLD